MLEGVILPTCRSIYFHLSTEHCLYEYGKGLKSPVFMGFLGLYGRGLCIKDGNLIEAACADGQVVRQYNENLNLLLNGLPTERINTIIDTVNDLCWEHDRQGFINGFRIGMRLEQEIAQ